MAPPAVIEVPIGSRIWVFCRNENGAYEYVYGHLLCLIYRDPGFRYWEASVLVRASDPSLQYKEDGVGDSAREALLDALRALRPRIDTAASQITDYRDFTRGLA